MDINYLYIDDEVPTSLKSLANSVELDSDDNRLTVAYKNPADFGFALENLINGVEQYQGLILDWRLDKIPQDGVHFAMRAGTVAQEIRIRQAEGTFPAIPIVLWSTIDKLQNSYTSDPASHDLFDLKYDKIGISDAPDKVGIELISLFLGYCAIEKNLTQEGKLDAAAVFYLDDQDLNLLPQSFLGYLKQLSKTSVHEYARIFLREIIERPGVLVCEDLLAAKLGIDIEQSAGWSEVLSFLEPYKYKGPFHEARSRWWWRLVEKRWWNNFAGEQSSPLYLTASERVTILKSATQVEDLQPYAGIHSDYQTNFQTICQYYRKPLDTIDGVTIKEREPFMWQEKKYLSVEAALRRLGGDINLRPHPVETERLELIKESEQTNLAEAEHLESNRKVEPKPDLS